MIFTLVFCGIVIPIIVVCVIWGQMKDKAYREEHNLPRRRYHDIVDLDVTYTYNLNSPPQKRTTLLDVMTAGSPPRRSSDKSAHHDHPDHEHDWY